MYENNNLTERGEYLNSLGRQYVNLVKPGQEGTIPTRTNEQVNLANEIVKEIIPLLYRIAGEMLYRGGHKISVGEGRFRILTLRRKKRQITVDELVSEAVGHILDNLSLYEPDKGALTTFIDTQAAKAMHLAGMRRHNVVYIPEDLEYRLRRIKRQAVDKNYAAGDVVRELAQGIDGKTEGAKLESARLVLLATNGKYLSLQDLPYKHKRRLNNQENALFVRDGKKLPEEEIIDQESAQELAKAISSLPQLEQDIIRLRYYSGTEKVPSFAEIRTELAKGGYTAGEEMVRRNHLKAVTRLQQILLRDF